jgi:hypothetical protein
MKTNLGIYSELGREAGRRRAGRILNRLLSLLHRSFAAYLSSASPWTRPEDQPVVEALGHIVEDQQRLAARVAEMVLDFGERIEVGEFPMDFTSKNFLSLDFILQELIRYQRHDIDAIDRVAGQLTDVPAARMLAEEAVGMAKAHLETLEELVQGRGKQSERA